MTGFPDQKSGSAMAVEGLAIRRLIFWLSGSEAASDDDSSHSAALMLTRVLCRKVPRPCFHGLANNSPCSIARQFPEFVPEDGVIVKEPVSAFCIRVCSTDMHIWECPVCGAPPVFRFSAARRFHFEAPARHGEHGPHLAQGRDGS